MSEPVKKMPDNDQYQHVPKFKDEAARLAYLRTCGKQNALEVYRKEFDERQREKKRLLKENFSFWD